MLTLVETFENLFNQISVSGVEKFTDFLQRRKVTIKNKYNV